jgi:hypothetical protein
MYRVATFLPRVSDIVGGYKFTGFIFVAFDEGQADFDGHDLEAAGIMKHDNKLLIGSFSAHELSPVLERMRHEAQPGAGLVAQILSLN